MKISKTKKRDSKGNRIILVKKGAQLDAVITDPAELAYVSERLAGKKNVAILNRLDYVLLFQSLGKEKDPKTIRLENARKAGFEIHSLLLDHEVESVTIINEGVE